MDVTCEPSAEKGGKGQEQEGKLEREWGAGKMKENRGSGGAGALLGAGESVWGL